MRTILALISLLPALYAEDAGQVFAGAVERQGSLRAAQIQTVWLRFDGHALVDKTTQAIYREYTYSKNDFRQLTASKARAKERTDRGFDGTHYWNRARDRKVELSPGNRDHRDLIRAIQDERAEFERILRLVLLTRLQGAKITLAEPKPVRLADDQPWSARSILGADREKNEYHVLRVEPLKGEGAPLLLYVLTTDRTVRKAVQFKADEKSVPAYYYYFAYKPDEKLPIFFSAHDACPTDKKTRDASTLAYGEIKLKLNVKVN